ncbi:hypothetical protein FVEN_g13210 [Fusarium venenatum]|nr:hypothetical protein FVEN_g13210 [Fusarium venenatum]
MKLAVVALLTAVPAIAATLTHEVNSESSNAPARREEHVPSRRAYPTDKHSRRWNAPRVSEKLTAGNIRNEIRGRKPGGPRDQPRGGKPCGPVDQPGGPGGRKSSVIEDQPGS